MGKLSRGQWQDERQFANEKGDFVRDETKFRDVVTAYGSSCFPAASGRYHLYVSLACLYSAICETSTKPRPWATVCNLEHIKHHYFTSHPNVNPTRIIPLGPEQDLNAPHEREHLR